jgi:hypothetical protein
MKGMELKNEQRKTLTTLLALVTLGVGSGFMLFPKLAGWGFGLKKEESDVPGVKVALRALGARDVALAIAFLANRDKPENLRFIHSLFAFCMTVDAVACIPALRKPGKGLITTLGFFTSIVLGVVSFLAAREDK